MYGAIRLSQDFGSAADLKAINDGYKRFLEDIGVVQERLGKTDAGPVLSEVKAKAAAWKKNGDLILTGAGGESGNKVQHIPMVTELEIQSKDIEADLQLIAEIAAGYGYEFLNNAGTEVQSARNVDMAISAVLLVVGLICAFILSYDLVRPISFAVGAAERIADGNLDNILDSKRKDECGQMLRMLGRMQDSLRETRE